MTTIRRTLIKACSLLALTALPAAWAGGAAQAEEKLVVWWNKGFYKGEDDALMRVIQAFEAKTGVKVELSLYATQDMIPKTVAALDAASPPDVAYSDTYNFQSVGKWAFEGRLEDLTPVLGPMKGEFAPNTLETTSLLNGKTGSRAYYAFPVKQATVHLHYWKDMLEQSGFKPTDIPKDWNGFWSFWCDKVQPGIRRASGKRLFGTGIPMGIDSTDSFIGFIAFMDAYNVSVVDENGKLTVDDPKVRDGLISALRDYTSLYAKGCTPPSSTNWKDADNNVAFQNKITVMTFNPTISIPGKWLDDSQNETLTAEQRAEAKKNYDERIQTILWPNKPDGTPLRTRASVTVAMVFDQSKNKARAKEFVAFLLQDQNLQPYVEGALGRWFPVKAAALKSPFWEADEHRKALHAQFAAGTGGYEMTRNFKFTTVNNENVWIKAVNRVLLEKQTVEQAVDEMIARIKTVAGN